MLVADNAQSIAKLRLITLRSAVKLEKLGMRRRGSSAASIAKRELGLPKNASLDVVLAALDQKIS